MADKDAEENDRDPDIHQMTTDEWAIFEHDFEVAVEMMERTAFSKRPVSGEVAYHQAMEAVARRRREDRKWDRSHKENRNAS